jgi:hypothetical protein
MLKICSSFAKEYKMTFNAAKSQFIVFRTKALPAKLDINFDGSIIKEQESVLHLGHIIHNNQNKYDIDNVLHKFYKQYNAFRAKLGSVPSFIQARLFVTYCSSFYGATLLPIRCTKKLQVAWRKSLRQVWRVPPRTHVAILRSLDKGLCDEHMFLSRSARFICSTLQHKNQLISYVMQTTSASKLSTLRENIAHVCERLRVSRQVLENSTASAVASSINDICQTQCKNSVLASTIAELTQVRDGQCECVLSIPDTVDLINFLCVT